MAVVTALCYVVCAGLSYWSKDGRNVSSSQTHHGETESMVHLDTASKSQQWDSNPALWLPCPALERPRLAAGSAFSSAPPFGREREAQRRGKSDRRVSSGRL